MISFLKLLTSENHSCLNMQLVIYLKMHVIIIHIYLFILMYIHIFIIINVQNFHFNIIRPDQCLLSMEGASRNGSSHQVSFARLMNGPVNVGLILRTD